eukprot:2644672-Pleurochrysis_carterae.AAC.9
MRPSPNEPCANRGLPTKTRRRCRSLGLYCRSMQSESVAQRMHTCTRSAKVRKPGQQRLRTAARALPNPAHARARACCRPGVKAPAFWAWGELALVFVIRILLRLCLKTERSAAISEPAQPPPRAHVKVSWLRAPCSPLKRSKEQKLKTDRARSHECTAGPRHRLRH